mmetsp:Transcript_88151/g.210557  ORF Transcript_88151/g.210557 Transcript_88151/m.210557 type:complete len:220 (+) Transcript_88151:526-1185(+)
MSCRACSSVTMMGPERSPSLPWPSLRKLRVRLRPGLGNPKWRRFWAGGPRCRCQALSVEHPQVLLAASWHRASGAAPAPWLQCRRKPPGRACLPSAFHRRMWMPSPRRWAPGARRCRSFQRLRSWSLWRPLSSKALGWIDGCAQSHRLKDVPPRLRSTEVRQQSQGQTKDRQVAAAALSEARDPAPPGRPAAQCQALLGHLRGEPRRPPTFTPLQRRRG